MNTEDLKSIRKKILCLSVMISLLGTIQVPVLADTNVEIEQETIASVSNEEMEDIAETPQDTENVGEEALDTGNSEVEEQGEQISEKEISDIADETDQELEIETGETDSVNAAGTVSVTVETCDTVTGEFTVRVKGVTLQTGESVIVPIWQSSNQEDIVWYKAEKNGTGYVVKTSTEKHGFRTGTYSIHVYKKSAKGEMTFLANTSVKLVPEAESLSVSTSSDSKASILLEGLKTYNTVSELRFAVWTGENGQDDIQWYKASIGTDGSCKIEIDLSKHSGSGICYVHAYAFTKAGTAVCVKQGTFDKAVETVSEKITITGPDKSTGDFKVTVTGMPTTGVKAVMVPIWSKSDQSDIIWYTAVKSGTSYIVNGNLSKHGWNTGTYHVHVYRKTTSGEMKFFGNESMNVAVPTVKIFSATTSGSTFKLTASGLESMIGITEIQIPVWSKSDQSDIVWYKATKVNNSYVVESDISSHKNNTGKYQAHLYLKGKDNKMHYLGQTSFTIQAQTPSVTTESTGTGETFKITLKNYTSGADVRFAVWSKENGQDDIQWYEADKSGSDYVYEVTSTKHRTNGSIYVHVYVFKADGTGQFLGATDYQMKYVSNNTVTVSDVDSRVGTFKVSVTVDSSISVKSVNVAIWSKSDQSNIKWYTAQAQSDGTYLVKMNYLNHGAASGTYQVHAYVFDTSGKSTLVGTSTAVLKVTTGIRLEKEDQSECTVSIPASALPASTVEVLCPTWSVEGGQDDIKWYSAVKHSDGSYSASISISNHLHEGSYLIDCYAKSSAGEMTMLQRLTTELYRSQEFDAEARAVMRTIIYAVETGGQVYGGHRYDAFTEAYKNSSAETAITIGAGAWFATEAKHLLSLIREQYPSVFEKYDTAGIAQDLDTENWKYYGTNGAGTKTILTGSSKALAIQNIIKTPEGIAVQDSLIDQQMIKYADQALALGVTNLKARLFCANIQHLGGYNAMVRIINYCKNDGDALTMENLWTNMREREAGSGNYVGSDLYASRHKKVMQWLNTYL